MKKSKSQLFIALALLLIVGLYLGDQFFLQKRQVASFEGSKVTGWRDQFYDLSELQGEEFQRAAKTSLMQGLQVQKDVTAAGVAMGNFLVKSSQGAKVYACEFYPEVEITLQAEGVAYSGSIPTMILRGPCNSSDDGKTVAAFPLPLRNLHQNLRQNPLWRVLLGDRGESFLVSTQFLYNEWPPIWNVVRVKLSNDQENIEIDGYEIISLLDQALTLDLSEGL